MFFLHYQYNDIHLKNMQSVTYFFLYVCEVDNIENYFIHIFPIDGTCLKPNNNISLAMKNQLINCRKKLKGKVATNMLFL